MKINMLICACIVIGLLSCKKSGTTTDNTLSTHRNMVKTESIGNDTYTYTYNDKNLIEKMENDDGISSYFTFTYFHDYIIQQYYDTDGIPRLTDTLFLDINGLVVSDHWAGHVQQYTYDLEGYRITEENRNGIDLLERFVNTIENGNCVKVVNIEYIGGGGETQDIHFIGDKLNSVGWNQKGQPYFGKSNVNLIDHIDFVGCTGIYRTDTYSYVYNRDGLVSKVNVSTPEQDYSINYTYY